VLGEELLRLVLHEVHGRVLSLVGSVEGTGALSRARRRVSRV